MIEKLKAAFAASTPGKWALKKMPGYSMFRVFEAREMQRPNPIAIATVSMQADADFIALAHEAMPLLFESAEALGALIGCVEQHAMSDDPDVIAELNEARRASNALHAVDVESTMTIGELMQSLPHFAGVYVESEVMDMSVNCGRGKDCANVLLAGNRLAEMCADNRATITKAVANQVRVFYFG